jgi:GGDEF domain-containing protein
MPSMPKFDVSLDESVAILKQVLPLMSQQRAPTIPQIDALTGVANRRAFDSAMTRLMEEASSDQ